MWMMPLHLHVNQKSDYDDDDEKERTAPKIYPSEAATLSRDNNYWRQKPVSDLSKYKMDHLNCVVLK